MLNVRAAVAADADEIGRVHAETWRAAYAGVLPETAFDVSGRQHAWREWFSRDPRPPGTVVVAEADGAIVGFAWAGAARGEPDGVGELFAIYVDASRWGGGVGRALLVQAEKSLAALGYAEAMLWVLEGNERAERFYRAGGWRHDGGRKRENFQGAEVTELRYRKPLRGAT